MAREEIAAALRLDAVIVWILLVAALVHVPLIPRSTHDARLLAAFTNDEPALSMGLDAMTVSPYGNPGNFYEGSHTFRQKEPGPEWGTIRYSGFTYYGGAYLGLGFLAYAPLKAMGLPVFPTAPLILRALSVLGGLLSLLVLYNFGKRHVGTVAGAGAALYLLADSFFFAYTCTIHPDSLQLLVGLLCLVLAVRHAADGGTSSLIALGLAAGISQGTKAGGPWLIPMVFLAIWWGSAHAVPAATRIRTALRRVALVGALSLAGFLVTTPYAFLDRYYWYAMKVAWNLVSNSPLGEPKTLADWLRQLYQHHGRVFSVVLACGSLYVAWLALRGRAGRALALALVLALTQVLWFGLTGGLWVVTGYLMVAYALAALFAMVLVRAALGALRCAPVVGKVLFAAASCLLVLVFAYERGFDFAAAPLRQLTREQSTTIEMNRWALANGIPPDAPIVHDDTAYFDPLTFKRARMRGGVLNWSWVWQQETDYIVLVSSLYGAAWFQEKLLTQRLTRMDPEPFSVRLYQDLLATTEPGPTGVPGISLIGTIRPQTPEPELPDPSRGIWPVLRGIPGVGYAVTSVVLAVRAWTYELGNLLANVRGLRRDLNGPELKIYRLHPRGGADGRQHAFSSGHLDDHHAGNAVDGFKRAWISGKMGAEAKGAYVGFDFGGGGSLASREVVIRWLSWSMTPAAISIQVSDDGNTWRAAGRYAVRYEKTEPDLREDSFPLDGERAGRYWRVVAEEVPAGYGFAISELLFSRDF